MAENQEKKSERFVNSIALACQIDDVTKHVQLVITADEDLNLHCYFDVIDPTKLPKFAE